MELKVGDEVKQKSTGLMFKVMYVDKSIVKLEGTTIHRYLQSRFNFDMFFEKVNAGWENQIFEYRKELKKTPVLKFSDYVSYEIDKIVHNKRKQATTVFFNDGDIIVVKRSHDTPHDIYNAVASAIAKKVYGNNTQFKKVLEKVEYI